MLSSVYRLTSSQVEFVKKNGNKYSSRRFGIIVANNIDSKNSKFGCVITLKIAPKATKRNQLKRILYDYIEDNIDNLKKDKLVLVLFSPLSEEVLLNKNFAELSLLFKKADIFI
jgi:ribonuclease P protein component